ncbi:Glutaredoxin 3 [subsurface metagenome]|jgi:glutaredoxin-like YruB-family protein
MATIKVYSTPTCPFCKRAKEFLKQNNFAFEDLNVAESEEARTEMINKSGQMVVPVLDIDGEIIVGFEVEKIKKALKI